MNLGMLDIALFLVFFALVAGFAMYKSRRERSTEDYFLASRGLSWPLIGLSIVAANISTEQMVGMAGQGAGGVGLAVSLWQIVGSVGIVVIAFTLLPRFLRAGIYTMPEFLEYRYNSAARATMAIMTVVIYVGVLMTAVLFSGGLTLKTIFGTDLRLAVWMIGGVAALYTTWGGLKAVAWADLIQGLTLLGGGALVFAIGLNACGGWQAFTKTNADRLHMILPADHPQLPWTGVAAGMWIVILYYCGLNQFIVQRNLAARSMRDGQLGLVFAGAIWLIVPFAIIMPGIMSWQLYPEQLTENPDAAFPLLIRNIIPPGLRGFIFAAIAGAVISSLASMLNSASTVLTMDIYKRLMKPHAPDRQVVLLGRAATLVFVVIACLTAPGLEDPRYGGVFQFIQQFQGYIWPGVVAAFVMGFVMPRAPGLAGLVPLLAGPAIYGAFQFWTPTLHFLIQVLLTFVLLCLLMVFITVVAPLPHPRHLPVREDMKIGNSPVALTMGALVIVGSIALVGVFW